MAKFGLLFPYREIAEMAEIVIQETNADIVCKKVIHTVESVNEARLAVEAGADIIIARGYQAMLIKKYTNIPVVELRLHAQEIGLLLKKAKQMLRTGNAMETHERISDACDADNEGNSKGSERDDRPVIGLVVFKNMLGDMSCMEELFDVRLLIGSIERPDEALDKVGELAAQGAQLFIGGEIVTNAANTLGYPGLIYQSSLESIREAFREAERMAFAMETEKRSEAQFETVLDATFNGIIKINAEGKITVINKLVEGLIGKNLEDVVGLPLMQVFPDFDENMIRNVLNGKSDSYTVSVNLRGQAWVLLMAPIQYRDSITGAILSLQKLSENVRKGNTRQREMYLSGFVAKHEFSHLHTQNEGMRRQIDLARKYALSDAPVLIYADEGTEYFMFGEAIHNNSARKNGPFVSLNIGALAKEEQMEAIFGRNGAEDNRESRMRAAAVRANHGTLFLKGIEAVTPQVQRQLTRVLMPGVSVRTDIWPMDDLDVRLIVSSKADLPYMLEEGTFSQELFYLLQGLVLAVPPLKKRPEDLMSYFEQYFSEYSKKYTKYLVTTNGAKERIRSLSWEGNLIQLRSFCERLVIMAERRSVDEVQIQNLYDSLYPRLVDKNGRKRVVVYNSPEEDELRQLMEKYHGNRQLIADELGISTTTLWRRMKKYGVEAKYQ
ncbi:MAG: PrpR N-terminal domain-containing protein [Lachnospiraceae bacterium]|nr:PrpR N-terminal domain-containing protein [Lachnospiraceae bacterium]